MIFAALAERFVAFRNDEDGAVTVDFVVLTSSVMLLGLAHAKDVADGSKDIAVAIENCLVNDIGNMMVSGDSATYLANLQAAEAACSNR